MLHGFTGSPWELRLLGDSLAARGFNVRAPLLPGHGLVPEAMLWVTARQWLEAAEAAVCDHPARRISLVGLSMGALLSVITSARWPERVSRLVLMAPVLRLQGWGPRALRVLRHIGLTGLRERWLEKHASDLEDPEARAAAPLLKRYPLARVLDLLELQDLARDAAHCVRAPTLVALAEKDHVVEKKAVEWLAREIRGATLLRLQRGYHLIPRDLDRASLFSEVAEFVDGA